MRNIKPLSDSLQHFDKEVSKDAVDKVILTLLTHCTLNQLDYIVNTINKERTNRYTHAA